MSFIPQGANLINGNWVRSQDSFASQPVSGAPQSFSVATEEQVHQACVAAEAAFVSFSQTSRQQRAEPEISTVRLIPEPYYDAAARCVPPLRYRRGARESYLPFGTTHHGPDRRRGVS